MRDRASFDGGRESDANFAGTWTRMANAIPGGWARSRSGLTVASTGVPLATFNLIFVLSPLRRAEAAMSRAVGWMEESGVPFLVRVRTDLDAEVDAARRMGLIETGALPGMVLTDLTDLPALPAGLEVRRVHDQASADDHLRLAADSFGLPRESVAPLVSAPLWGGAGFELYVAYRDGRAVATSALSVTSKMAGVYNVAVPLAERGQGLGAALTAHAVRQGAHSYGAEAATLQASTMGLPVYERMGFRTVRRYAGFVSPA